MHFGCSGIRTSCAMSFWMFSQPHREKIIFFGFFEVRHANRGRTKYGINIMLSFMLYAMLTCLDPCVYAYVYMFICLDPYLHMFLCLDSFFACLDLHPYMLTCLDLHVFMPNAVFSCFDLSFLCIVV